jgi:hypothetical protein
MNERIRELYDQCWFGYDDIAVYQKDLTIDDSMGYCFDTEKFAELIVRECTSFIARRKNQAFDDDCDVDEAVSLAIMDLLESFGFKV